MEPIIKDVKKIKLVPVEMEGAEKTYMAWLISDKDAPVTFAMRIFKVEPGGKIPLHSHWYCHEIFCLQGKGKVTVAGKEYIMEAWNAVYVPPEVPHSYENIGDEDWIFLCMIPLKND